jgi:NAD-dependent dihydropyrimidine dehydrogenase PreA subunit
MKKIKRSIIKIDEEKCNGCGVCIPNCPEGAMQLIDGKARLISDLFCDGLGACIGHCPQGAISIEERNADEYNESRVMENVVKQGKNVIKAHLEHLKGHGQTKYLNEAIDFLNKKNILNPLEEKEKKNEKMPCGCPGSMVMDLREVRKSEGGNRKEENKREYPTTECQIQIERDSREYKSVSELRQWPVQIMLVPPTAPYLDNADLLIAADCVPFAYPNFHNDFLKGKILLVGCPKLDDIDAYGQKFRLIFKNNNIKSVNYVHMEVPCCFGMINVIEEAILDSGKIIPFKQTEISINGEKHG